VERVVYWRVPIMPSGPLGGPRPLANGDVVLLMTTRSSILNPRAFEMNLKDVGEDVSVDLDPSVDTYSINTGLDSVELEELVKLSNVAEDLYTGSVEGFSVGFQ